MSEVNLDPNNYEFERCADCVGVDCTMAVRMVGAWPAFNVDMEVDAVKNRLHTMETAAERIERRRLAMPLAIERAATRLLVEFGCGWSPPHVQEIIRESIEFYDQHGTPPMPYL